MILIDANILLYSVNSDSPLHERARRWWEETLNGNETVGLPAVVLLAFLRITTRPGLFQTPLPVPVACTLVEQWLDHPLVIVLDGGSEHLRRLTSLLRTSGTGGNLTTDAYLAALAIEYGSELQTTDGDFARFPGLRWTNPLAS